MESRISGHTGLLAVIGSPIAHSASPKIYNYGFERLGLDYVYVAFDIKENEMKDAIAAMRTYRLRGCNVTMPGKTAVVKYMDELSPAARIIGAVNTIVNDNGRLKGYITDGEGAVDSLRDNGVDVRGKKIVIAGAGGAATAIQVQCALDGAREIVIFNRTISRAEETAQTIRREVPDCIVKVCDIADVARMTEEIRDSDILINATSVGMKPMEQESIVKDVTAFHPGLTVLDAVYEPVETRLLREAKAAHCHCIGGKSMLLWQAAAAFKLYTGQKLPVEELKEIL